jgi:DNA helicase IV
MDKLLALKRLRVHVLDVGEKLRAYAENLKLKNLKSAQDIAKLSREDQELEFSIKSRVLARVSEVEDLEKSPYFTRCEVQDGDHVKAFYFSKYEFAQENIYSWVAPVSTLRFESIGPASYRLPSGDQKNLKIVSKEHYLIENGKVMYFSHESKDVPRTLIHQENFSNNQGERNKRKSSFVLAEIVAQM